MSECLVEPTGLRLAHVVVAAGAEQLAPEARRFQLLIAAQLLDG